jgi:hypothetical protein
VATGGAAGEHVTAAALTLAPTITSAAKQLDQLLYGEAA